MPYGTLKVDTVVYTSGGVDATTTISGLANGTFPSIVSSGTISGATITGNSGQFTTFTAVTGIFTNTLSGATVTGNTGNFTTFTANGGNFTSVTGTTVTGTTANFVSGVFTTRVSGATVTGTSFGVGTGGIVFADGTTQSGAVSTANFATLTGAQTFTGGQRGAVVTVAYATGIALNLSTGNNFQITLTGNTTLQNPTNLVSGQAGVVTIIQGSSGNTMAFATGWQYPGGSGSVPSLTTTSGAIDLLVYYTKDTSSVAYRLVQNVRA